MCGAARAAGSRLPEEALREVIEVAAPGVAVVAVVIDVPEVRYAVLLGVAVHALGEVDQAVFVAARDVEELELLRGGGGIGEELGRRLGVGS